MFSGKLFSKFEGVSKKGNSFYTVDLMCDLPNGQRTVYKAFVSEDLYRKLDNVMLDSLITVKCGLNNFGNLCVNDFIIGK